MVSVRLHEEKKAAVDVTAETALNQRGTIPIIRVHDRRQTGHHTHNEKSNQDKNKSSDAVIARSQSATLYGRKTDL